MRSDYYVITFLRMCGARRDLLPILYYSAVQKITKIPVSHGAGEIRKTCKNILIELSVPLSHQSQHVPLNLVPTYQEKEM